MTTRRHVGTVLLAVVLVVAACGDDDSSQAVPTTVSVSTTAADATSTVPTTSTASTTTVPAETTTTTGGLVAPAAIPVVDGAVLTGSSTDGTTTWEVVHPVVSGSAADGRINAELRRDAEDRIARWQSDAAGWGAPEGEPSTMRLDFEVTLLDDRHVSVLFLGDELYAGAAHPGGLAASVTFDHTTGERIDVAALFATGSDWRSVLAAEARRALEVDLGAAVAADLDLSPSSDFSVVNLTPSGLRLTFPDGSIGPHALGQPTVDIPYAALAAVAAPGGPLDR